MEQAPALAQTAWQGLSRDKRAPYEHISSVERQRYETHLAAHAGRRPALAQARVSVPGGRQAVTGVAFCFLPFCLFAFFVFCFVFLLFVF